MTDPARSASFCISAVQQAMAEQAELQGKPGLGKDKWNLVLLVLLYGIQGIPLGLSSGAM